MKNGIENLYPESLFTDDVYTKTQEECDDGEKTMTRVDKNKFLEKVKLSESATDFDNFKPLVEYIKSLLK